MGDLYGKDMDNLKRHMGGGEGRRPKKRDKESETNRVKGGFEYVQEKYVYVGINGKPRAGNTIRCAVHDMETVEQLRARIGMLLFYDTPCKMIYMEDGIVLHNLIILNDQDYLFASTKEEPFWGEDDGEKIDVDVEDGDDDVLVDEKKTAAAEQEQADVQQQKLDAAKKKAALARPRKFFQPRLEPDDTETTTDTDTQETKQTILDKYGGAEHFQLTDMLSTNKGPKLPRLFMPVKPSEEQLQSVQEVDTAPSTIDPSLGKKALQKAGVLNTTEKALKELLEKSAKLETERIEQQAEEQEKQLLKESLQPQLVGVIGDDCKMEAEVAAVPAPNRKQRKAEEQAVLKRKNKRNKQREKKRQRRQEEEATKQQEEEEDDQEISDEDEGDDFEQQQPQTAADRKFKPKPVPTPYTIINPKAIPQKKTVSKRNHPETRTSTSTTDTTSTTTQPGGDNEKGTPRATATLATSNEFVGPPRPPPKSGDDSSSDDDDNTTKPPKARPVAAYQAPSSFVGPPRPPGGASNDSSSEEETDTRRPAAAYQASSSFVGPARPAPQAADDSDSD